MGSDKPQHNSAQPQQIFQSTLPAWGATYDIYSVTSLDDISIHAPRMGSDIFAITTMRTKTRFQSTLPAWGATSCTDFERSDIDISIHAPRMGSDLSWNTVLLSASYFNPRSPHGERLANRQQKKQFQIFQSTLPAWGATDAS